MLMPNLKLDFFTKFDINSIFHFLFSFILAVVFGFAPSLFFGIYYEISQSYMARDGSRPYWSYIERKLFTSEGVSDLYDILLYNFPGALLGAIVRYYFLHLAFYGALGV